MLKHIAHDERQIVLSNHLLAVAQFGDALRYAACLLWSKLQAKFFKIPCNVGLAAVLAKSILALSAETLRHKVVAIKVVLIVTIGMNASHLSKDILANDRLVGSNSNARIAFYKSTNLAKSVLAYACFYMQLVFKYGLDTCKRCIAATLAKPVYSNMQSACPCLYGCQ